MRMALKCWREILLKKYQSLWKAPLAAIFFPLSEDMNQTQKRHCLPPPPLQTHQASFLHVIWCPHCIESNRALHRRKPVGQAPKLFKPLKNAALKCRPLNPKCSPWFRRLLHLVVMKIYSRLWLYFCVTEKTMQRSQQINLFSERHLSSMFQTKI